jgi:hypothetical protein
MLKISGSRCALGARLFVRLRHVAVTIAPECLLMALWPCVARRQTTDVPRSCHGTLGGFVRHFKPENDGPHLIRCQRHGAAGVAVLVNQCQRGKPVSC